jgi:hypothetical protein
MARVEPMHAHAADDLRFIRDAMARATEFTALPGWGGVAMGVSALATAAISGPPDDSRRWIAVWLADAAIAAGIGLVSTARKAQRSFTPLSSGAPVRRFALAYVPALAAGAILTAVLASLNLSSRLPGCWLLLYGTAVAAGGAFSIRIVPIMGALFMALGTIAFVVPARDALYLLAAGFGGLHIVFGLIIARHHDG